MHPCVYNGHSGRALLLTRFRLSSTFIYRFRYRSNRCVSARKSREIEGRFKYGHADEMNGEKSFLICFTFIVVIVIIGNFTWRTEVLRLLECIVSFSIRSDRLVVYALTVFMTFLTRHLQAQTMFMQKIRNIRFTSIVGKFHQLTLLSIHLDTRANPPKYIRRMDIRTIAVPPSC